MQTEPAELCRNWGRVAFDGELNERRRNSVNPPSHSPASNLVRYSRFVWTGPGSSLRRGFGNCRHPGFAGWIGAHVGSNLRSLVPVSGYSTGNPRELGSSDSSKD